MSLITIYVLLAVVALGLLAYVYSKYQDNQVKNSALSGNYIIDGKTVTEKEFYEFKSTLIIEENFIEGFLSAPSNDNSNTMTMEYGNIQIHEARSKEGVLYEYTVTSIGKNNTYTISKKKTEAEIESSGEDSQIVLGKSFFLKVGETLFYQNASFTISRRMSPFSRDPVTGIEEFPHDIFTVNVSFQGDQSTLAPGQAGVKHIKTEVKLDFHNYYEDQEFYFNSNKYELQFISYDKDGRAEFVLNKSTGMKQ